MAWIWRKLQCGMGHSFEKLMEKGSPPPDGCPVCDALIEVLRPAHVPDPEARSENVGAPAIRGRLTDSLKRFEHNAFVRPHFDDGKPMLTNLRDDVREGESYAVPETPSTNEMMRMMHEQVQAQKTGGASSDLVLAANMASIGGGWGWGTNTAEQLARIGPQNPTGRPVVDLNSKKARPA